ncbi:carbonate dehydratase [Ectothiorhodospira haloalkaliphila]|uniref:Carbonate dehydratase n=1 Tax=Ectothiorhodospira haloalkaliphila TaxID=421628 RepID=W8L1M8_9GAMM|nr:MULTISPECIES: carbonate dehydratase [Ectothiorhodospira]AHK77875.1 carbonate dehydratase [Ectothiorhodospira haloalkaliphila]MCG5495017.1 carbonate dehydratase [Ectothiorhodospira variabilis]MCG5496360.1 carbonate dehydratase [Ectothiorhodospira variabilis]MCG5504530.1 carbonate dehydratase [Ectothiorhodospira variabilis]MCG5507604.1 carbonate dehydratase [Ectothiorhodospira variabilis]
MIRKNPTGHLPKVAESAFVDPTAILCGKVVVGEHVFIGPYAVIRADELDAQGELEPIIIGDNSNIQDGVVIHSKSGARVEIGEKTSIAHRSIIHGPCKVGSQVFIGFNTVLFNCSVGAGSVIRHNSVVEDCHIPESFYVPSTSNIHSDTDLETIESVTADASSFSEDVAQTNVGLVQGYKRIQNEL